MRLRRDPLLRLDHRGTRPQGTSTQMGGLQPRSVTRSLGGDHRPNEWRSHTRSSPFPALACIIEASYWHNAFGTVSPGTTIGPTQLMRPRLDPLLFSCLPAKSRPPDWQDAFGAAATGGEWCELKLGAVDSSPEDDHQSKACSTAKARSSLSSRFPVHSGPTEWHSACGTASHGPHLSSHYLHNCGQPANGTARRLPRATRNGVGVQPAPIDGSPGGNQRPGTNTQARPHLGTTLSVPPSWTVQYSSLARSGTGTTVGQTTTAQPHQFLSSSRTHLHNLGQLVAQRPRRREPGDDCWPDFEANHMAQRRRRFQPRPKLLLTISYTIRHNPSLVLPLLSWKNETNQLARRRRCHYGQGCV